MKNLNDCSKRQYVSNIDYVTMTCNIITQYKIDKDMLMTFNNGDQIVTFRKQIEFKNLDDLKEFQDYPFGIYPDGSCDYENEYGNGNLADEPYDICP